MRILCFFLVQKVILLIYLDIVDIIMQIMIYSDSMLFLRNMQPLYQLLLTHARTLHIWGQFIPPLQTPLEMFQMVQILTITGMVHQYLVRFLVPMGFQIWIFIITVGSTIPIPSL